MSVDNESPSTRGRAVKVALVVVLLGVTGFITYSRTRAEPGQLDTPESADTYVCLECGQSFALTPAKLDNLLRNGGVQTRTLGALKGTPFVRCEKCGQFAALMARICPNDGTPLSPRGKDGKPGKCPKCGWSKPEKSKTAQRMDRVK